jgi:hypothetical protein
MLNLFQPPTGILGDQEEEVRKQMQMQGLLGLASGLFQAGTPSRQRQSLGGSALQGLMAGQQMAQGTFDQTLKAMQMRQQMEETQRKQAAQRQREELIANLSQDPRFADNPTLQAFLAVNPEKALEMVSKPDEGFTLSPGQVRFGPGGQPVAQVAEKDPETIREFNRAKELNLISPNTTLEQYAQIKRGPLVQNILGGETLTAGQKKVDESFAPDYVSWRTGGGQDMVAQIAQLKPVITALEEGKPITGLSVAVQPDLLLAITNPSALQSREQVEEVVQRNLRAVLGAQFTEKEGERLIARAYNPKLPPAENAKRLRRLFLQMATAAEQKQAMVDYFDEQGTLRGFKGKMPSLADFESAMEGGPRDAESLADQARKELERRGRR